jgi:hypothetical protein
VKIGTGMAHTVAAKTEAQQAVGLYLADDDDAEGEHRAPAGRHRLPPRRRRRRQALPRRQRPAAVVMGVAGYFTKQVAKIGVVRQLEAGQAAGDPRPSPRGVA